MDAMSVPTVLERLRTCPTCGLAQLMPDDPPPAAVIRCGRCHTALLSPARRWRSNNRTAAVALAALILYPLAVLLPIMRVEQLGHDHDTSILGGTIALLADGHLFVGLVVLLCSVVLPLVKLVSLLVLAAGGLSLHHRHRAMTYHLVEWTGRWGMLDVLLVAVVVSLLKLGDMVTVTAGEGAIAFTAVVVLSLVASACFDPHALWRSRP